MNHFKEHRYVAHSQALPLTNAHLYFGEDASLRREVILIEAVYNKEVPDERYISKLRQASCLVNKGFLHILDTFFEEHSVMIVLQHKPGKPLTHELNKPNWTFSRVVTLAAELGVSMLDAMEEQISGFSVSADNLWLNEDDRLSVIHYWEEGKPQTQGALGLCGLILQLFTGSTEILGPYEPLDIHLERVQMAGASAEEKEALVKLVRRVCQGQASLSTLTFGLKGLSPAAPTNREEPFIKAPSSTVPISDSRVRPTSDSREPRLAGPPADTNLEKAKNSSFNKKVIAGTSASILVALLIWILWPSPPSDSPAPAKTTEPGKPVQESTPPSTKEPQPSPQPSASENTRDGEEIAMPNLIGMTQADAEQQSLASRLHYSFVMETNPAASGTVFKQEPAPGSQVKTGDDIKFWVSKGSQ